MFTRLTTALFGCTFVIVSQVLPFHLSPHAQPETERGATNQELYGAYGLAPDLCCDVDTTNCGYTYTDGNGNQINCTQPYNECVEYSFVGCERHDCKRIDSGPWRSDTCTTTNARVGDSCALTTGNYCFRFQNGECSWSWFLEICICDWNGTPYLHCPSKQDCETNGSDLCRQ